MLRPAKTAVGCVLVIALVHLGAGIVETPGSSLESGIRAAAWEADFRMRNAVTPFPKSFESFSDSAGSFVRSNAAAARLQLEDMKNSLPSSSALSDWVPADATKWMEDHAGSPRCHAPDAQGAISSTSQGVAAVRQSLNHATSSLQRLWPRK